MQTIQPFDSGMLVTSPEFTERLNQLVDACNRQMRREEVESGEAGALFKSFPALSGTQYSLAGSTYWFDEMDPVSGMKRRGGISAYANDLRGATAIGTGTPVMVHYYPSSNAQWYYVMDTGGAFPGTYNIGTVEVVLDSRFTGTSIEHTYQTMTVLNKGGTAARSWTGTSLVRGTTLQQVSLNGSTFYQVSVTEYGFITSGTTAGTVFVTGTC